MSDRELNNAYALIARLNAYKRGLEAHIEMLEEALRLNMKWIGPPHTDPHSYDSQREDAWAAGIAALKEKP